MFWNKPVDYVEVYKPNGGPPPTKNLTHKWVVN